MTYLLSQEVCVLVVGGLITIIVVYFALRTRFPVNVECWFCGHTDKVPRRNQNSFHCTQCDQYNGFTKEGDYNKPIEAQYTQDVPEPTPPRPTRARSFTNNLCDSCNRYQTLKVKQLAAFEPIDETNYDEEVAQYKAHLENIYKLCTSCEHVLQQRLAGQHASLHERLGDSMWQQRVPDSGTPSSENTQRCEEQVWDRRTRFCLHLISLGLVSVLLFHPGGILLVCGAGFLATLSAAAFASLHRSRAADVWVCLAWLACVALYVVSLKLPVDWTSLLSLPASTLIVTTSVGALLCSREPARLNKSNYSFTSVNTEKMELKRSPSKPPSDPSPHVASNNSKRAVSSDVPVVKLQSDPRPHVASSISNRAVSSDMPGVNMFQSMSIGGQMGKKSETQAGVFQVPQLCQSVQQQAPYPRSQRTLIQPARLRVDSQLTRKNSAMSSTTENRPGQKTISQQRSSMSAKSNNSEPSSTSNSGKHEKAESSYCKPLVLGLVLGAAATYAIVFIVPDKNSLHIFRSASVNLSENIYFFTAHVFSIVKNWF